MLPVFKMNVFALVLGAGELRGLRTQLTTVSLALSFTAAQPIMPPGSILAHGKAHTSPSSGGLWTSLARTATTFKANLGDPRFFTMVLLVIATLNFVTVVFALALHGLTRRPQLELPLRGPHLRAVSHVRGKSI